MGIVSDLKPCPFCGGTGAVEPYYYEGHDEDGNICERESYYTRCTKCGVSTPLMSCEEAAQDAWEERYITPSADVYTSPPPTAEPPLEGKPRERAVQVCCKECAHLERVNGRVVEWRCTVTGVSFPKYATDKALINPATFSCSEAKSKTEGGR